MKRAISRMVVVCGTAVCLLACGDGTEPPAGPGSAPAPGLTDGEWLAGDLHVHSEHSDDSSLNPVARITALAQSAGMDYLALTDHDNHVDGDVAHHTWTDPDFLNSPLIMLYGAEWTTQRGHGNTFSARPYDHQTLYDLRDEADTRIGEHVRREGIHLSANHPATSDHFGFSYDIVRSIEVWQSAIWPNGTNEAALVIWDDMLKSGRDLTGRGGSDSHHGYPQPGETPSSNSYQAPANNVGTPTTWVFAADRSAQAVVDALDNGRVSVSANPAAPRVEFHADLDADGAPDLMMGDNAVASGEPVTFQVKLVGSAPALLPYTVRVVTDGYELMSLTIFPGQSGVQFTDTPPVGQRKYYRVEVTGPPTLYPQVPLSIAVGGNMVALSNPIYFNFGSSR
ncbi:CehA/McbA family metallohydrolase [Sinimarinibacterium flocculans]|uniref:Polymerase/histidinol phosphatase N-terminal domain-containing protein n=1 Tax=Sinimarinibacterium flocculans TaxID=985250 RepID=A0A318EIT3_9GAMM|nr:CehA/McbA family metallohydrolase [Sinimarinibacterium flocculans]PXV70528.1 hypothetical protein C8D93_102387 [Sinimarinibacterium flocculans]